MRVYTIYLLYIWMCVCVLHIRSYPLYRCRGVSISWQIRKRKSKAKHNWQYYCVKIEKVNRCSHRSPINKVKELRLSHRRITSADSILHSTANNLQLIDWLSSVELSVQIRNQIKCIPQRCLICGAMLHPNSKDTHRYKRMFKQMAANHSRVVQSKVNTLYNHFVVFDFFPSSNFHSWVIIINVYYKWLISSHRAHSLMRCNRRK